MQTNILLKSLKPDDLQFRSFKTCSTTKTWLLRCQLFRSQKKFVRPQVQEALGQALHDGHQGHWCELFLEKNHRHAVTNRHAVEKAKVPLASLK